MFSLTKLKNEILPSAFEEYGLRFVSCDVQNEKTGVDQFASNVLFIKVKVKKLNKEIEIPVVVKVEPHCESVRNMMNTSIQFYNEVFMYSKVFPLIEKENNKINLFPNFYHGEGSVSDHENNIIIIEDLSPKGYLLSDSRLLLDFDHLSLALGKLGQFHALSYAAKQNSPKEFYKQASCLQEVFCLRSNHLIHELIKACLHRAIDPLIRAKIHVEVLQNFLSKVDNDVCDLLLQIVSPEDPLAVICHGDFCRNNVLFKYIDGKPIDVKLFDFATSRLSSPAIDISFLLFLNASKDLRTTHWDDLLDIYHRSLTTTVPGTKVPSLQEIRSNLQQKGVWGFVHCSFFLPMMLYDLPVSMEELSAMEVEDFVKIQVTLGGEVATRQLSELAEELADRQMFDI